MSTSAWIISVLVVAYLVAVTVYGIRVVVPRTVKRVAANRAAGLYGDPNSPARLDPTTVISLAIIGIRLILAVALVLLLLFKPASPAVLVVLALHLATVLARPVIKAIREHAFAGDKK